jgi:Phosphodiester glycosidase
VSSRSITRASRLVLAAAVIGVPLATTAQLPLGSAAAANAVASSSGCRAPNTTLLTHKPQVTKLPGGATLNVWDNHGSGDSALRISVVAAPASSPLHLSIYTTGALTRAETPTAAADPKHQIVAVSNGDVFDPGRGALPVGDEVLNGKIVKGEGSVENTISISASDHSYPGHIQLYGKVSANGRHERISGLNWQSVTGSGINVYAAPWGPQRHPAGSVEVVVRNGKVVGKHYGSATGAPPGSNTQVLTGFGSAATFLEGLKVGEAVTVKYGFTAYGYIPRDPVGKVEFAVHRGAPYWLDGRKWPIPCDSRDETLRPRTAIGWTRNGTTLLMAISAHGGYLGGSTLHNVQYYTAMIESKFGGKKDAETMDGGTSTTLAVRHHLSSSLVRVDQPGTHQRPVPNFLALSS